MNLYDVIIKDVNKKSIKELSKLAVWKKIFSNKTYDDARFRKYFSDLLKLITGYLTQQSYEADQLYSASHLIKAAEKKGIDTLYQSSIRNARNLSNKVQSLSAHYFFHQYKIEDFIFEVSDYESNRDVKPNYEQIMVNLDYFFLAEKLRLYAGMLSRQRMSAYKYDVYFIDEVMDYVSKNLKTVTSNVEIWYRICLTYIEVENTENYNSLKTLLEAHAEEFTKEESYHKHMELINYCIKRVRLGNDSFVLEMFDLYKMMISNKVIYIDDLLSAALFKNIISVSTRLKEFKWAENFIEANKQYLPEDQKENMVTFNLAMLAYQQKKHSKVIELLREVEYSDISLSLQSKTILLMTYYDTDEYDPLEFLLESFRVYLNRHKEIPQHRKDYFKNLIKFTKKLTKIIPGDKTAVAKIKQEIEATEGFRVKWLEEKIAELE
ncbi:MAG: hypothetical protein AAF849_13750 [Bacteroidota bacterium]